MFPSLSIVVNPTPLSKALLNAHRYSFSNAKEDASKVACLAFLIKDGRLDMNIEGLKQNRGDVDRIKDFSLPNDFSILNKLKAISPESFYLWAVATEVIQEGESDK